MDKHKEGNILFNIIREISITAFASLMTALTFWPFAFDVIDYIASVFGFESKYTSFFMMPSLYWAACLIFWFFVAYKLGGFLLSLLIEMSYRITESQEDIDKKRPANLDLSNNLKIVKAVILFFTIFGSCLYCLDVRFKNIEQQNKISEFDKRSSR